MISHQILSPMPSDLGRYQRPCPFLCRTVQISILKVFISETLVPTIIGARSRRN